MTVVYDHTSLTLSAFFARWRGASSSLIFTASSNPLEDYSLREILRNTPESISDLSACDLSLSFWPQIS